VKLQIIVKISIDSSLLMVTYATENQNDADAQKSSFVKMGCCVS
jgi:hypothetical protein